MEAIVLAGGLGRRLRSVVPDLPKPMAPVNGRPFLEHLLDYWAGQGVRRFILSVGYRHDAIRSHFGCAYHEADITYAVEDTPLGTGGGLLRAMTLLAGQEDFVILNGDTYFEVKLAELVNFHVTNRAELTLALREVPDCSRYTGIELGKDDQITAFHARGDATDIGLINGGVYLAARHVFEEVANEPSREISLEDDVFPRMLACGRRFCGYRCQGRFIDIGVPDDYRRAAMLLATAGAR